MVGRNAGYVTTQGEILTDHLGEAGYATLCVSAHPNRYLRLLDMAQTVVRQRHGYDLIILQVYSGASFVFADLVSALAVRLKKPVVFHLHGGALPQFIRSRPAWGRRVLARGSAMVAPSRYLVNAVAEHGFKAEMIRNIVDVAHYPFRHRLNLRPRLFWMRAFEPVYNPEMAVRTLAELRRRVPDARLVMAGQAKGLEQRTAQLAEDLGVAPAIHFPGFVNLPGKLKYAEESDLFLNTNRIDNTPVGVVEACAFGLPVVATRVGGLPHLLTEGETGLLVPSEDYQAAAEAATRLLSDHELAGRLSSQGRRLAEEFSWNNVLPRWEQIFQRVLAG
ncbi:MAG: glycosyltransferase family 4 protein [Armatimonadota bacterium]